METKQKLKHNPQVVSVRVLVAIYDSKIGFNIPKAAAKAIGVKPGSRKVWVTITSQDGLCLYSGKATLKSGNEIYETLKPDEITSAIAGQSSLWLDVSKRH